MKYSTLFAFLVFILVPFAALADGPPESVQFCNSLAELSCQAVFAPCVANENAKDRQAKKNAEWTAACSFDVIDVGVCAIEVGTENPAFCKCIAEQAECPRVSVGKCVANFAAEAQAARQAARLADAFGQCF